MLEQITIRNYKCLADVTLRLGQFNVLIGPNDSGKTSVLEAIQVLGRMINEGVAAAFGELGEIRDMLAHGARDGVIAFEATMADHTPHSVSVHPEGYIADERMGGDRNYVLRLPGPSRIASRVASREPSDMGPQELHCEPDRSFLVSPDLTGAEESLLGAEARRFREALTSMRCDSRPASIRLATEAAKDRSVPPFGSGGRGLPTVLEHMLLTQRKRFHDLEERLRVLVPRIAELDVMPVNGNRQVAFKLRGDDKPITAPLASDGLLILLGYLTLLYLPGPRPSILLVDEPENGIHPGALCNVVELLRELCKTEGVQVVMTTHSPYLLDFVKPEEVHIMTREEDLTTKATRMSDIPNIDTLRKGYKLGELWFNYGEEELIKGVK